MSFSGRWCKFDDDRVTEFNAKALGRECFGGVSYEYSGAPPSSSFMRECNKLEVHRRNSLQKI